MQIYFQLLLLLGKKGSNFYNKYPIKPTKRWMQSVERARPRLIFVLVTGRNMDLDLLTDTLSKMIQIRPFARKVAHELYVYLMLVFTRVDIR